MAESNWFDIKQSMIDEIVSFKKDFLEKASTDISRKLSKNIKDIKISKNKKTISKVTKDEDEFNKGKIYFEEVYNEINNQEWIDKL